MAQKYRARRAKSSSFSILHMENFACDGTERWRITHEGWGREQYLLKWSKNVA